MRKQFIVTLDNEDEVAYDDWDGIDVGAIKDAVAEWTNLDTSFVTVEEISSRGAPKRINKSLTMLTYVTEDAL